jgi:predicted DCC family thiol-disulfide oxidoreductase YuxK
LHAKDHNGQMHMGIDALLLIWKQLKRWHILAIVVGLPIIHQIADVSYRAFAKWRFKRFAHCQLAAKKEEESWY